MVDQEEIHRMAQSKDEVDRYEAAIRFRINFELLPDKQQTTKDLLELKKDIDPYVRWKAASTLGLVFAHVADKEQEMWTAPLKVDN